VECCTYAKDSSSVKCTYAHRTGRMDLTEELKKKGSVFNRYSYSLPNILTRGKQNSLHCYVLLSSVAYAWLLWQQFSLLTILRNVMLTLTESPENRLENDMHQVFFITNSSAVHIERLKRSIGIAAFLVAYQITKKHNPLKNNTLHRRLKISFFADNFSKAPKYSILRALTAHGFNIQVLHYVKKNRSPYI